MEGHPEGVIRRIQSCPAVADVSSGLKLIVNLFPITREQSRSGDAHGAAGTAPSRSSMHGGIGEDRVKPTDPLSGAGHWDPGRRRTRYGSQQRFPSQLASIHRHPPWVMNQWNAPPVEQTRSTGTPSMPTYMCTTHHDSISMLYCRRQGLPTRGAPRRCLPRRGGTGRFPQPREPPGPTSAKVRPGIHTTCMKAGESNIIYLLSTRSPSGLFSRMLSKFHGCDAL